MLIRWWWWWVDLFSYFWKNKNSLCWSYRVTVDSTDFFSYFLVLFFLSIFYVTQLSNNRRVTETANFNSFNIVQKFLLPFLCYYFMQMTTPLTYLKLQKEPFSVTLFLFSCDGFSTLIFHLTSFFSFSHSCGTVSLWRIHSILNTPEKKCKLSLIEVDFILSSWDIQRFITL